jgi:hypothetical protein
MALSDHDMRMTDQGWACCDVLGVLAGGDCGGGRPGEHCS